MSGVVAIVDSEECWPEDADDVDEGVVTNWFAREGKRVEAGETLCEIQVEKVSVDVPSPVDGELAEIAVGEQEEFERGDTLARVRPAEG
ncbi:biotin attachment protein [Halostella sp. JP-L12]|uniref:lipoyl domain-containing protein n=1 Tax=Halostella TaxID=1843185 RepID=UPI000EF7FF5C|nr:MULTISPECIES: lipoyl domain-containing protein [Halostella]NHN48810.1 biotin attachment protein [Halostella sp. JP-L12]